MIERIKRSLGLIGRRIRLRRGSRFCPPPKPALPAWATAPTDAYPVGFNPWILHDRLRLTPGQTHRAGAGSR